MALEGTLEDFSLADIFQLIGIQRKTGVLTLKNSLETVTVTFFNGMVIGADSHPKKLEDRIGVVLVKTGLITQDQLKEALGYQEKTLQKIGFILVNQHYISREQLKEALQIQVTQTVYRLFRWNSGEYYFDQKARVDPESDESIAPVSAESILMEGIHMIDEWPIIQRRIHSFEMIFRPTLGEGDWEVSEDDDENFDIVFSGAKISPESRVEPDKIRLSKEEDAVFRLVNGKNTVAEIIERSKLGEFHTCKTLYDLLERKIIDPLSFARPVEKAAPKTVVLRAEKGIDLRLAYLALAVIIGALVFVNFDDPLRIAFFRFFEQRDLDDLKTGINSSRLSLIDSTIIMYYYVNGTLPEKLEDLVTGHYLSRSDIIDPWSRPYVYGVRGNTYILASYTPDGILDQGLQYRRTLSAPREKPQPKSTDAAIRFEN